jgi:hypothetical protein
VRFFASAGRASISFRSHLVRKDSAGNENGPDCTFNLKDFPLASVEPHKVKVKHPADFLIDLYTVEPGVVVDKLQKLAEKRGLTAQQMLIRLGKYVPEFCDHLTEELGWQVD